MPFFTRAQYSPEVTFLNLLAELDNAESRQCAPRQHKQRTFTPKFDIVEVDHAYELYGELPGLQQEDISVEFADAQTLVVKGRTERGYKAALATTDSQPESKKETETSSSVSHSATVEDDYDEADIPLATPASTSTAFDNNATPEKQVEPEVPAVQLKFWASERQVGGFSRSFAFSQRVEQDEVKATLNNGILHVIVPKSQKSKKVAVSVL
ncbi:hypothetical protein BP5796_03678 [Coleophoma crateriformis]|uniref:SHSP domain-containing protein n=1 Tax=Coleophoma crateriformis TaxID=565419 RepID=A0A3D8SGF4_9HELO|nr:hypothetical protein BP5796_03678 [Coleophoma crateriformis]